MIPHQPVLIMWWLVVISTVLRFPAVIGASDIIVPLYQYDDYDRCRMEASSGVYCLAKVILRDESRRSQFDTDFRRNILERGICIAECQRELAKLNQTERNALFQSKIEVDFVHTLSHYWKDDSDPLTQRYAELSNVCINQRLNKSYNITGFTELEHCTEYNSSENEKLDLFKIAFAFVLLAIFSTLIVTNIISWMKCDAMKDSLIISAFSIRRNWARLMEVQKTTLHRDFAYIEGVRVLVCLVTLYSHAKYPFVCTPTEDQRLIERAARHPLNFILLTMEVGSVKIFLAITGLLLTVHFLNDMKNNPKSGGVSYCVRKVLHRLFRLLPVYFVFLLHATVIDWIPGVEVGLGGYKAATVERNICRKYAWTNLLFINNLPLADLSCMAHTWYMAADLQLFVVGLLVLESIRKWPWILKPLLGGLVAVSASIVGGIAYFEIAEPFYFCTLSEAQLSGFTNRYFRRMYCPSYTNLGCFIFGIIVGFLYHHSKHHGLKIQNSLFYKAIKRLTIPIVLFVLSTELFLVQRETDCRQLWVSFFAICYFFIPVLVCCVLFIENLNQSTGPIRKLLSSKPMAVLAKLSYGIYIVHIPAVRVVAIFLPLMVPVAWMTLLQIWVLYVFLSSALALVVYFCVEQPAQVLLRGMFDKRYRGKKKIT